MQADIERLFDSKTGVYTEEDFRLFQNFRAALNAGRIRAAEPDSSTKTGWRVNTWVKKGILVGFRMGGVVDMSVDPYRQPWLDKATYPVKRFTPADGIRIVPGGSSIRDGCYIGKGVTCMPPMFINTGTWVGDGTMIDSHALVGSCAQVGANCHISAAQHCALLHHRSFIHAAVAAHQHVVFDDHRQRPDRLQNAADLRGGRNVAVRSNLGAASH